MTSLLWMRVFACSVVRVLCRSLQQFLRRSSGKERSVKRILGHFVTHQKEKKKQGSRKKAKLAYQM